MKPILISCALAMLMAMNAGQASGNDFDASIAQARESVEKSSFAQALEAARRARALNPGDFRSYYYEAMAQLGLGKTEEARAAVQAAQARAPASAKDALQKLAQMASDGPAPAAQAAAPTSAVIVSCTVSGSQRAIGATVPTDLPERTLIRKLENGAFYLWSEEEIQWKDLGCHRKEEVISKAGRKSTVRQPTICDASKEKFYFLDRTDHTYDPPMGSGESDWMRAVFTFTINRLTGAFSSRVVLADTMSRESVTQFSGTCRPAKDPSAAKPKF